MKKIKILHLITRFIKGGADENTLLSILGLKDKYDITLGFGCEYDINMINKLENKGIKIKVFSLKHNSVISSLRSIFEISFYLKKEKFDIIHTHSTEAGIIGRIAAKLAGISIIIHTIHGIAFSEYRSILLNSFIIHLEQICARFSNRLISNSDNIQTIYLNKHIGKRNQFITIYSGIDFNKFKTKKKSKNNIPIISMISRLAEGKGHKYLLLAAKEVLKQRRAEFWIVGDGEYEEQIIRMIADMDLQNAVKLLGHRDDIPEIISESDISVLPSLFEGTPRCIIESLRLKTPVIATNVGGIPELIEDTKTGFLISPKNHILLADRINYLLNHPKIASAIAEAGFKESHKFSSEDMVQKIDKVYLEEIENLKNKTCAHLKT